eukprot:342273-Chlamydomonas_euryale.AAC.5
MIRSSMCGMVYAHVYLAHSEWSHCLNRHALDIRNCTQGCPAFGPCSDGALKVAVSLLYGCAASALFFVSTGVMRLGAGAGCLPAKSSSSARPRLTVSAPPTGTTPSVASRPTVSHTTGGSSIVASRRGASGSFSSASANRRCGAAPGPPADATSVRKTILPLDGSGSVPADAAGISRYRRPCTALLLPLPLLSPATSTGSGGLDPSMASS